MKHFFTAILFLLFLHVHAQNLEYQEAGKLLESGKYPEAFERYQEAGEFFLNDNKLELYAYCHIQMGKCHLAQGELLAARSNLQSTLDYIDEMLNEAAHVKVEAQLALAETQLKLGRTDLALEILTATEGLLPDSQSLLAAQCYNDLGVAQWNAQNHSVAIGYHEKALTIRKQNLPQDAPPIADSHLNIGLVQLSMDFLKAIINFNNALKIYNKVYGPNHPQVALCYSNLAFANSDLGNFADALRYIDQTMQIWAQTYPGDHPNKAYTYSSKGRILVAQGNLDEALVNQQEALQMYLRLYGERHPEIANTYYLIGDILLKQNEFQGALENFQKSVYANLFDQSYEDLYELPDLTDFYDGNILLTSLQAKAQALEALHFGKTLDLKDLETALETYSLADDLIGKLRQTRLNESDKLRIGNIATDIYSNAIRIAQYLTEKTFRKEHFSASGFAFCERSKSAVLLEAIGDTKAKSFAGIPDEMIQKEENLQNMISALELQLAAKPAEPRFGTLKKELFDVQQSYYAFVSQLEKDYPRYFELKYQSPILKVSEIQKELAAGELLLSYYLSDEELFLFEVRKDKIRFTSKKLPDDFHAQISAFRNGMRYQLTEAFTPAAKRLYDLLIPPLKQVRQVTVIPHGVLGTIPFEALVSENKESETPRYLIQDVAVSYDYAAQLFLTKKGEPKASAKGILLTAPVSFEYPSMSLNELPASEQEIKEIKYLFLGAEDKPEVQLRAAATEATLKSDKLSKYRFLHFATHGVVNANQPALSRIFLTPDQHEDGNLYAGEIYGLNIGADLVTLSACETGLGKLQKGEGIIGLSRSLMYAGAKNLLVSLWQVADASTSQLMIDFYKQHLHHSSYSGFSDDLRNAKLAMLKSDTYQQPYYWAPFILIGQ